MRVPVSWLREYLGDIGEASIEEIDAALVRMGLEVEAVHTLGGDLRGPIVVGEVREITELTEFKKPIRHVLVDVGEAEPRSIVCGATNFAVGDVVVAVLPGAVLPGGFAIASRKTYGHLSDGMICSLRELGLGDEHSGILVLDGLPEGVRPGSDAIELLGLVDTVIELAITPDRGYCLSMRGVARELASGLGLPYRDPGLLDVPTVTDEPPHPVTVVDTVGCDRFVARAVRGIDPSAPTPLWMRRRLLLAGVRSISLAVDVTNYLMLELGQPMHAFDLDRLSGPIVVRRGAAGERVRTLDGADRSVHPEDLLITDDTGPIGLAAVMGGATTEVSAGTTNVLIECAHWDPVSVARSARRHKLPSEASKRFERGVDPEMAPVAAERAVQLLSELAGGVADDRVLDLDYRRPRPAIRLDVGLPARVVGVDYDRATVEARLFEIGSKLSDAGPDALEVLPASWRPDLTDPIDLVEEVARLEGYDNIPPMLPPTPASPGLTVDQRRRRSVSRALAEAGFVEVLSYPFVSPSVHDAFGLAADDTRRMASRLANPISDEEPELRTSLLPGLLKTLARNLGRGQRELALFEVGLVVHPRADAGPAPRLGVDRRPTDDELEQLYAAVPEQPLHVGVVLAGDRDPAGWWGEGRSANWADAVEAARVVAATAGVQLTVRQGRNAPWHPGRCAELIVDAGAAGERVVGHAGELHPGVLAALSLPARTCAMELDLDMPAAGIKTGPKLSSFPPALIDVALVVSDETPAAVVGAALVDGAGELLESLRLFDVFSGPQLGAGRKSLAYALTFRAADRTLTVEEATAARDAAVAAAAERTGAVLR